VLFFVVDLVVVRRHRFTWDPNLKRVHILGLANASRHSLVDSSSLTESHDATVWQFRDLDFVVVVVDT
jgi:hypothetical protein